MRWLRKRYRELVVEQGLTPEMARSISEGQITNQLRNPKGPLIRTMLDQVFEENK
jgi:hypothetical protein